MRRYVWYSIVVFGLCSLTLYGLNPEKQIPKEGWAESVATIHVGECHEGFYGYTLTYEINDSIAVNAQGEKIKGPVEQYGISRKEPVNGQNLQLIYLREEPIIFELLDPIQYKKP